MSEIQQQVADGAQPRAKVGDVIEHGQAIPANFVRLADSDGDDWVRDTEPDRWRCEVGTLRDRPKCKPAALDPAPQPARCTNGPDCRVHPDADPEYTHEFDGTRMYPIDPAGAYNQLDPEPVEISQHCQGCGNWMPPPALHKATCPTRTPGPLVLTLPEVPAEAVALRGNRSGHRWTRLGSAWWSEDIRAQWSLCRLLSNEEPEGVTPEFAPPREPRVWPRFDGLPDDVKCIEVDGIQYRRGSLGYWVSQTGHPGRYTSAELHLRGDVREVLDDGQ